MIEVRVRFVLASPVLHGGDMLTTCSGATPHNTISETNTV